MITGKVVALYFKDEDLAEVCWGWVLLSVKDAIIDVIRASIKFGLPPQIGQSISVELGDAQERVTWIIQDILHREDGVLFSISVGEELKLNPPEYVKKNYLWTSVNQDVFVMTFGGLFVHSDDVIEFQDEEEW